MMAGEKERGGAKKHIQIRADSQDIPPHLPLTQQRNIRFSQRPSSAHNPCTQPLPFLKLRRWRPLSAGGSTTLHSSQAKGKISETEVSKPPVKSNKAPMESKSKRELTLSERNYKKSRLMKFTYPTQMHNWVGPQPNEAPSMLKRSVPRCLQRRNYYARLPQRHACHYAPWKSITHVNRHQFTSFSLPHPRNKKEQEALAVKAKNTPRTPRHAVKEPDTDNEDETVQNVLELAPSADNHDDDDENISKNGSYHYVYEESNTNQTEDPTEEAHSVKSARSEEYEYQEIPINRQKNGNDTEDYENDFDQEEHRNGNRSENSDESGVNNDTDDDTHNNNKRKSSSRRSSKISNGSSKGKRRDGSVDDDIDEDFSTSRKSSRVSAHSSRGRRDSSNESIIDEVESTKAKDLTKIRDSIASEEIVEENDETNKSAKPESKGRRSSSEAESVGSDDAEDTEKRKHCRPNSSNKNKSFVRSSDSSSESGEEKELDTGRKTAVSSRKNSVSSNRKQSIISQESTIGSRKNSISKRKGSASTRKSSIVSDRKDSITSQNSYVSHRRSSEASRNKTLESRKNSIASDRKDSVVSQKSVACSQKDSASRRSVDSDGESKR